MKLEPFDIERVKAGEEVVARDGNKAKIICYDTGIKGHPLAVVLYNKSGTPNEVAAFSTSGGLADQQQTGR